MIGDVRHMRRLPEEPVSRKLRVAVAQLGPIHLADSREDVVKRLIALLREAHGSGARFVVFPELALTTFFPRYWMTDQAEIDRWFEPDMPSPETRPLFDLARERGIGFYLGYAELTREQGQPRHYNTAILVDPVGHIVGRYRKIHLPGHAEHLPQAPFQHLEKRYFDVGNEGFKVWRMLDAVVGMCICNDRRWPETFRVMGLQGAEIVALGYNTPIENIHHPEPVHLRMFHHLLSLQANAYQNAAWVLAAAKCGAEDGHAMIGGSAIVAPTGEIAAQALTEDDELVTATLDLELGEYIRRTVFNFAKHRRIEHYGLITSRTGAQTEV
jgi:N-carbamoyl-D-amino-acid hydrolase